MKTRRETWRKLVHWITRNTLLRFLRWKTGKDYVLVQRNGAPGILCLTCGMESFLTEDISVRYCGNCNRYHTR